MDLDKSVKNLNAQADRRNAAHKASALSRLSTTAPWSAISSVVSHMVPYGGGLIEKEWIDSHNDYQSGRLGPTEFRLTLASGEDDGDVEEKVCNASLFIASFVSSFVPRFKYVRVVMVVTLGSSFFLVCNCHHFDRCGIPCRHLFHIKRKYWKDSGHPVATDIHPMWRANHKAHAFTVDKEGCKLPASAAVEHFAKGFPDCVVGLQVPTSTPDHHQPIVAAHPDLELLSAAERCVNWPTKLILELLANKNISSIPSLSQQVTMFSQESEDSDGDNDMGGFEARFVRDTAALQKQKEEKGDIKNALIPLTKELIIAVEKAPHSLEATCTQLRDMISDLNGEDEDEGDQANTSHSMVLPASKKSSKSKSQKRARG